MKSCAWSLESCQFIFQEAYFDAVDSRVDNRFLRFNVVFPLQQDIDHGSF